MWATLESYGVGKRLIQILKDIGERSHAAARVGQEIGKWFETTVGTRQGDPLSPTLFVVYLGRVMDKIQNNATRISEQGEVINNVRFADDTDMILADKDKILEANVKIIESEGRKAGLET